MVIVHLTDKDTDIISGLPNTTILLNLKELWFLREEQGNSVLLFQD